MVNHIKLYEIAATARNFEAFKVKYGKDVSDEQIKSIFDRFTKQQSRLQVKDIFKYTSLKDLTSALETKANYLFLLNTTALTQGDGQAQIRLTSKTYPHEIKKRKHLRTQ